MRQAEEARRDSKREKEEKRMEQLRERELEKEKEFQIKEKIRLEEEARRLREYNTWKDPYSDSQYSLHQDENLSLFMNYLFTHKVFIIFIFVFIIFIYLSIFYIYISYYNAIYLFLLLTSKIVSIQTLSYEFNIPIQICLQLLNELLTNNKLSGVVDGNGIFYLISDSDIVNLQTRLPLDKKIQHETLLSNVQEIFL